jgi:integrase
MAVSRKGNGWGFVVDLPRSGDGKRRQKTAQGFKSKAAAAKAERDALREAESFVADGPNKTIERFMQDDWLPAREGNSKRGTLKSYRHLAKNHLYPTVGARKLRDLTPLEVTNLGATLTKKGLASATVAKVLAVLSAAYTDAESWGLVARNPCRTATRPRITQDEMKHWSPDEVKSFLASATGRCRVAFVLALNTGMRKGELAGLRWTDVDLDNFRLVVRQARPDNVSADTPKTANSKRTIPLSAAVAKELVALRDMQLANSAACEDVGIPYDDSGYLFTMEDGTPYAPDRLRKDFDRRVKTWGGRKIRFHDTRHTYATCALAAGVPVKVVSEILGHATVAFTLQVYAHVLPGQFGEAAELVASIYE